MLAGKALVENKCKILQLAEEVLNDLHQQKTKILLKGLTHKAYKPEEKEQKLSAAEGDVHREFKKQKMNYSEDRLCKNLLDHHVVKKKAQETRIFIPDASRFLPGEKRDAALWRQELQIAKPKMDVLQRSQKLTKSRKITK